MKLFVEPRLKVTRFEYENIMDTDTNVESGPTIPEIDDGGDMEVSLWGE